MNPVSEIAKFFMGEEKKRIRVYPTMNRGLRLPEPALA